MSSPVFIEIDGRPANAEALWSTVSAYGHFTAMQVRGRRTRGAWSSISADWRPRTRSCSLPPPAPYAGGSFISSVGKVSLPIQGHQKR